MRHLGFAGHHGGMQKLLDALGNEDVVGVNLDTGNSWLGGGDPHADARTHSCAMFARSLVLVNNTPG